MLRTISTRSLGLAALASLSLFPVIVGLLNLLQRDRYDAVRQAMSELALGRDGWLMAVAFTALGAGSSLIALIVRRVSARPVVAPALLALTGLLSLASAVFRTDADGAPPTFHGQAHMAAGVANFVLLLIALPAAALAFRRSPAQRPLVAPTMLIWLVAAVTFLLLPLWAQSYLGVGQRVFVGACVLWLALVGWRATRAEAETTSA